MKELFIDFLKWHNAYESFTNNLDSSIDELCETEEFYDWIEKAFTWSETSEGYDYWCRLESFWLWDD